MEATGVIVDSTPPGINQNVDAGARTITFSGQPTASGIIAIRTTPDDGCDIIRLDHRIFAVSESITPDYILVQDPDGVADDIPLFSNDEINYNTEFYLCAGKMKVLRMTQWTHRMLPIQHVGIVHLLKV